MNSITLLILTLCLLTAAQASHFPDLFEALDSLLCQNVEKRESSIIDIKHSIALGAELLDGQWIDSMESCVAECCEREKCDFALFKNEGASTSGKNCYFVSCGGSESNCIVVRNDGFTSAVIRGRKRGKEEGNNESPLTTPPPTSTHAVTPPQPTTPTTSQQSQSNTTPTPVPHSKSTANTTLKPTDQNTDTDSESKTDSNTKAPEIIDQSKAKVDNVVVVNPAPTENGGSGVIAVVIVGVVCFTVIIIVVAALARKVWNDRRRKRFRNVDYLINGMYT